MPEPTIESRVSALERTSDRAADALDRLSKDLHDIKGMMAQSIGLATRVSAIEQDSASLCADIEMVKNRNAQRDTEFAVLKDQHAACHPTLQTIAACKMDFEHRIKSIEDTLKTAKGFAIGQLGSLLSQIIPWVLGAAAVYAVSKGALK